MRKYRLLGILGAAAVALVVLLASAVPAGAQSTIIVNPGESIQAAVDAAEPGTTIIVRRGTYAEDVAITTDGLTLRGKGATLVPPAQPARNNCSFEGPPSDGICVLGELEAPDPNAPPVVVDPVSDVKISGFTVSGFPADGIFLIGAEDPVVSGNRLTDNGEYGVFHLFSTGGRIEANRASGSGVAGIYVGGSPDADVLVRGNEAFDNELSGFFIRDAGNGRVVGNRAHTNCVGALVLNTGENTTNNWRFVGNRIFDNDKFCPGEDDFPALSGIGIGIAGGSDNRVVGNVIRNNNPSGDAQFSGGVVLVDIGIPGADPPSGNRVVGNLILGNEPDIFWDGSGDGNVFRANLCETSVPDGLC